MHIVFKVFKTINQSIDERGRNYNTVSSQNLVGE